MKLQIGIWYGSRFVNNNTITQFYYPPIECMGQIINAPHIDFFNMPPNDFNTFTHKYIVAVWHIKPRYKIGDMVICNGCLDEISAFLTNDPDGYQVLLKDNGTQTFGTISPIN